MALSDREADDAFTRHMFLDPKTRFDFGLDVSIPGREHGADGAIEATIYLFEAEPQPRPQEDESPGPA